MGWIASLPPLVASRTTKSPTVQCQGPRRPEGEWQVSKNLFILTFFLLILFPFLCPRETLCRVRNTRVKSRPSAVAPASRRGHPFASLRAGSARANSLLSRVVGPSLARERDAPATAGGTPALLSTVPTIGNRPRNHVGRPIQGASAAQADFDIA